MSKTTVIALAGKRIEVRPSPTSPGCVLIQILSADRAVQVSVTLEPGACGALESGIEAAAWAASAATIAPADACRAGRTASETPAPAADATLLANVPAECATGLQPIGLRLSVMAKA